MGWQKNADGTYTPTFDPNVHGAGEVKNGDTYIGKSGTYTATDGQTYKLDANGHAYKADASSSSSEESAKPSTTTATSGGGEPDLKMSTDLPSLQEESGGDESLLGHTITDKVSVDQTVEFNSGVGDELIQTTYGAQVTGQEGLVTIDESTVNKEFEGGSISVGPLFAGFSLDGSVYGGYSHNGHEGHLGFGIGNGLGAVTWGGSTTNENGQKTGQDQTFKGGIGTVAVAAAISVAAPVVAAAILAL